MMIHLTVSDFYEYIQHWNIIVDQFLEIRISMWFVNVYYIV